MLELPRWLVALRDNEGLKQSFNSWADDAIKVYEQRALFGCDTIDKVYGLRYAVGEIESLRSLVNDEEEELKRIYDTQGNAGA